MWEYLLHRLFGIGERADRVRIGAGVVGHTTYAILAVCAAASAIAWGLSGSPGHALGVIAILAGLACFYFLGTWIFAHRHPDQAAMGGSEWRRFREAQFASKHQPEIPLSPGIPDPSRPLPPPIPSRLLNAPDTDQ